MVFVILFERGEIIYIFCGKSRLFLDLPVANRCFMLLNNLSLNKVVLILIDIQEKL